ncbi:MAG: ferrous iron transport protein B, partial [Deltaproteobacteria bacterium]
MRKILISGMPGVGKSTIFRLLVKRDITCSNYPGTAIPVERGTFKLDGYDAELIDIPGTYNLTHQYENEIVARRILAEEKPDVIIQVADTKNLKRMLTFTGQLAEFGIPLVLALNMVDEADQMGLKVIRHLLEEKLGTAVVETVATDSVGISELHAAISKAKVPLFPVKFPSVLAETIKVLEELMPVEINSKSAMAALCLSDEKETSKWAIELSGISGDNSVTVHQEKARLFFHKPLDRVLASAREHSANKLYSETTYTTPVRSTPLMEKIGDFAREPVTGILILLSVMVALYYIVGQLAAGLLVDFLVKDFFGEVIGPRLDIAVALIPYAFLREMITGKYGLYPMGLVPALGLVLPIIIAFYFTFGFIEDSGYFSRLSILLDRLFKKLGMNGKALLPIMLGFSCVSMATIATRVLETKKERLIAIFLLSLGIPCSAKLSVILVVLARVSFGAFMTVFGVIFSLMLLSGVILSKIIPSAPSHFIMDVPPIRIPSLRNVLKQTYHRSASFLKEAAPLFFAGAISLFLLDKIGFLSLIERALSPVIKGFLGLPEQFAESLIMGFIRGEAGIAILKQLVDAGTMSNQQLVVAMIVTILFIPC